MPQNDVTNGAVKMWQIMKDVRDGKMKAQFFTDQWPKFTTVISQEFTPRLSEVADIRIHSTNKGKIMQVINGAHLLEDIGTWQLIHYHAKAEEAEELCKYLLKSFQEHPNTKEKTASLIFDYKLYRQPVAYPSFPVPPGYVIKDVPPEHAEFLAKYWRPATIEYPLEHRIRYIKDLTLSSDVMGVYTTDNFTYPVSWGGRKTGGVHGMSYTLIEHRKKGLISALWSEFDKKPFSNQEPILTESNFQPLSPHLQFDGYSHIIAIY